MTTLTLTPEQEMQLQHLIDEGRYDSPEAFLETALSAAYAETEAFTALARAKLAASQADRDAGRVTEVPRGGLASFVAARNRDSTP